MTIRSKSKNKEIVIDLTGPDGNAFVLLGYARSFGRQLGLCEEAIEDILDSMKQGDYEDLLDVFDSEFGDFVVLER
jgi:hypothetical protein